MSEAILKIIDAYKEQEVSLKCHCSASAMRRNSSGKKCTGHRNALEQQIRRNFQARTEVDDTENRERKSFRARERQGRWRALNIRESRCIGIFNCLQFIIGH